MPEVEALIFDLLCQQRQVLQEEYNGRMAAKLGMRVYDRELVVDLMKAMYEDEADFTNTFR